MCLVMGKGRVKAVEKRVLDQKLRGSINVPSGPVYYPTEEEFKDPLEYIYKIKPEAEIYGICKIVPPNCWKPPFGLDLESVKFPTKTQEIHRLQFRPASCNPKTFQLEYNRFLEEQLGKKLKKKVVFEGEELDLCKLFNAVKRFGGYDKVFKGKKWGEVYQFMSSGEKISKCAKHVLCQLYKEHLHDFENYHNRMNADAAKGCKRKIHGSDRIRCYSESRSSKRRKRYADEKNLKVENEEEIDQACEQCKSGKHGEVMLLCDSCNKGWHIYCLSPPLKHIPLGNWYCLECLNTDEDTFGFVPGKCLSLEDFKRIADRAKRKWFGSGSVSRTQIEKKFWEIVEGSGGEVEVMYGNDLDTSVYGSGFPRIGDRRPESVEANIWDEYCGSPWNLNNMPKLKGSMLQAIRHNINGVTVPWLYLGMLFSSFCWHFEDHCFYSVNYLHWGEAKCWYGVPGSAASAFEMVMRKTLPDLFDAQPDLLFQLVTMLSPTVLQENKVPVYTVVQEPGNFVITFPKSFHAGFNFGLNCAEAVNFATADWLPHGGSGAELYRLYRKPSVISHEELLCVVAKENCCNSEGSIHLKKELLRIYSKEKNWREQLWKSGILRSSPLFLPECPDSVGIEEDPTCIICQQFLHLSAIVCNCRPSVFACLEHWKHLCECKPTKLRLVYRYTLAELDRRVQEVEKFGGCKTQETKNSQRLNSGTKRSSAFNKKREGMQVSQARPADDWLLRASMVLDDTFSSVDYATLLNEAEQFLWAGSEMDRVRDVTKSLIKAKIWAEAVSDCLSKVEGEANNDSQKVHLESIYELLRVNPVPCFQSGYLKLKDYAEEARRLSEKIDSALSSSPTITQLELLHSEVSSSPISLRKHEILSKKISSAKMLAERARIYLADTKPPGLELDALFKIQSEMLELQVQLPETEGILDLLKKSESARDKCNKVLSGSLSLENVEELLQEFDSFSINIPELNTLRQYHVDTLLWISRFNDVMVDVREGKDQRKLISDLSSLLQDGASVGIQVEGLPLVEVELKKASCREKARTVYASRRSLDFIEQLLSEAVVLHIEEEKLFIDISGILSSARCWEERASSILAREIQMYDLKHLVRMSVNIYAVLPSLKGIENTISSAETWLQKSEPFLSAASPMASSPGSLLELPVLKDLVCQSKSLNVQLQEPRILETLLLNCERWQCDNHQLLQETEDLLENAKVVDDMHSNILPKIMDLIRRVDSARKSGLSLGLNFDELPKLRAASRKLEWCYKTITLSYSSPSSELLKDIGKPSLKQIQQHLKEGQTLEILPEDCFGKRLMELKDTGMEWAKRARKVVTDSGALALEVVFELISEGENLPVHAEQELQSLRARSMLHCICLKPYNSRSMVSCSQCGEWYHTYCLKLHLRPKAYVCSACCPLADSTPHIDPARSMEPETQSLNQRRTRMVATDATVDDLQWKTQKRIKRIAKRIPQVHILPWFFT